MGWDFTYNTTKADLVAELTKSFEVANKSYVTLKSILTDGDFGDRGHLWAVVQATDKSTGTVDKFVMLYLIQVELDRNRKPTIWGYKSMSESEGPHYYDCPLELLELAGPPDQMGYAPKWRSEVLDLAGV